MNQASHHTNTGAKDFAAVYIDYENLLYHLKKEYADPPQVHDVILNILRSLRARLNDDMNVDTILMKAYADFERIATAPLGSLYLMGVDTHNVLGTDHKNAADMQLCIDLMDALHTRPDIRYFVLVAGDRDYIPVVKYLRNKARKVMAVAFRKSISGDLRMNLGDSNILEALDFIPQTDKEIINKHKETYISQMGLKVVGKIDLPAVPVAITVTSATTLPAAATDGKPKAAEPIKPVVAARMGRPGTPETQRPELQEFKNVKPIADVNVIKCLQLLLEFMVEKKVSEVWLTPFLRTLRDKLPLLADYERKDLITTLSIFGAISVEKRISDTNDYSVVHVNYNHPTVMKVMP